MKQLLNAGRCPKYAYYSTLNLSSSSSDRQTFKRVIVDAINENGYLQFCDMDTCIKCLENVPADLFILKKEREIKIRLYAARLKRMADIFRINGFSFAGGFQKKTLHIEGKDVEVTADFFVSRMGKTYSVKLLMGESALTTRRTKNFVGNDVSLYAAWIAFPNTIPAVFGLRAKKEKATEFPKYVIFELADPKKWDGKQWFSFEFNAGNCIEAQDELKRLAEIDISKNAEKNETECDTCPFNLLCHADTGTPRDTGDAIVSASSGGKIKFTEEQERVINFREGEARVLACAGSGKTTTIAARTAKLVEDGEDPTKILMITFTEKGSEEMKQKLQKIFEQRGLNPELAEKINVFTFNKFGNELIMKHWERVGFSKKPSLVADPKRIISYVLNNNHEIEGANYISPLFMSFSSFGVVIAMEKLIESAKRYNCFETGQWEEAFLSCQASKSVALNEKNEKLIISCIKQYDNVMRAQNLIDYGDQINIGIEIARNGWAEEYNHIMIDEFQDTSSREMKFVEYLYKPGKDHSLMVIGDDNQGIYSFRGVGIENIVNFNSEYPKSVDLPMSINFRSTNQIVDKALTVIEKNKDIQIPKEMRAISNGKPVEFIFENDKMLVPVEVSNKIKDMIANGVPMSDCAILARTRGELMRIDAELTASGIPHYFSIAESYHSDIQMQTISALAEFIQTGKNFVGLASWIRQLDPDKFDNSLNPSQYTAEKGMAIKDSYAQLSDEERYDKFIEYISKSVKKHSRVFQRFLEDEENENEEHSFKRVAETLRELTSPVSEDSVEADETKYNAVTLSTIHAAKGREWDHVILITHGSKALRNKITLIDGVETLYNAEEIRLLFVGVTRAKKELTIIAPENQMIIFFEKEPENELEI